MKLAFYIPSLGVGGAERVVVNLSNEFSKRGHSVDLVTSDKGGKLRNEVSKDVDLIQHSPLNVPGYSSIGSVPFLSRYLKQNEPEWLYSAMNHANIPAIISGHVSDSDTNIMISEHNTPSRLINHSYGNKIIYSMARYLYPHSDCIITVSDGVKRDLVNEVNISPDKLKTVYNPIVTPSLIQNSSKGVEHPWFKSDDIDVILGMGRLHPQKRFSDLIRAFSRVDSHNSRLVIIGTGQEREKLEQHVNELNINDQVDFLGYVENPYKYLRNSSVFALSSAWEGFGNVLVEALACGCPVVSTNCPNGPNEILADGEYGTLVPVGDIESLSSAIERTIKKEINQTTLKKRADDFHVDEIADQYELLFEQL
ncbi:glycosyl transferase [Haloferax sp. Atlit-4N]|uniref:glycosyltransferase n=1 Tax=Haloferax sp. Atlit-4N TaxID=2077206 RepID=UPI000E2825E9|nr:glycosyltransferase [Haloferax sp. Atlit-4N]RDZ52716.1 glycosyl transferase [Haloferax sp. Atlit-4N]